MSEKEMDSYRFASGEEPSDEMLSQIMKEVAQEAAESNKKTEDAHLAEMRRKVVEGRAKWAERINSVING